MPARGKSGLRRRGRIIYSQDVDIFSPCALGADINQRATPQRKAIVVAGTANNHLERRENDLALASRGILYAPDYVINAGGIINLS